MDFSFDTHTRIYIVDFNKLTANDNDVNNPEEKMIFSVV